MRSPAGSLAEVAHQEVETFKMQRQAQDQRIETEKARGTAEMQAQLAESSVGVAIKKNSAEARKAEADGESTDIERTGTAQGAQVRAVGLARAEPYQTQVAALGRGATGLLNAIEALSRRGAPRIDSHNMVCEDHVYAFESCDR